MPSGRTPRPSSRCEANERITSWVSLSLRVCDFGMMPSVAVHGGIRRHHRDPAIRLSAAGLYWYGSLLWPVRLRPLLLDVDISVSRARAPRAAPANTSGRHLANAGVDDVLTASAITKARWCS